MSLQGHSRILIRQFEKRYRLSSPKGRGRHGKTTPTTPPLRKPLLDENGLGRKRGDDHLRRHDPLFVIELLKEACDHLFIGRLPHAAHEEILVPGEHPAADEENLKIELISR